MNWKDSLLALDLELRRKEENYAQLHEKYLERIKPLYETRRALEIEYEYVDKVKVLITPEERINRALEILRVVTPNGSNWSTE